MAFECYLLLSQNQIKHWKQCLLRNTFSFLGPFSILVLSTVCQSNQLLSVTHTELWLCWVRIFLFHRNRWPIEIWLYMKYDAQFKAFVVSSDWTRPCADIRGGGPWGHCFRKAQSISQGLCTGATVKWHVYLNHTGHSGMPCSVWGPCKCPELLGGKSYTAVRRVVVAHPCQVLTLTIPPKGPLGPCQWCAGPAPTMSQEPSCPVSQPWAKGVEVDTVTNTANQDLSLFLSGELAAEKCQDTRASRGGGLLLCSLRPSLGASSSHG